MIVYVTAYLKPRHKVWTNARTYVDNFRILKRLIIELAWYACYAQSGFNSGVIHLSRLADQELWSQSPNVAAIIKVLELNTFLKFIV